MTTTALVPRIEHMAMASLTNPKWCHAVAESEERWRKIEAGEMPAPEPDDMESIATLLLGPGGPRHYPLPNHLHWMGARAPLTSELTTQSESKRLQP